MLQKIRSRKGFTLVELMIVVAIIGILAAIAIPNFLNFRLKAKTSEAKANLGAIRSTEVAYYAEFNMYVANQTYTPNHAPEPDNSVKLPWILTTRFSIIGFAPEGQVYFDYQLEPAADYSAGTFSARAHGDLDNDDNWSDYLINEQSTEITHYGAPF